MKINSDLLIDAKIDGNIYCTSCRSKNIFNKDTITANKRIDSYGDAYDETGYFISDFIEILPSTQYTISRNNAASLSCYAFYDSSKTFISRSAFYSDLKLTFTTTSGAKYMRITDINNNLNSLQVEFGDMATSYKDFTYINDDVDNAIKSLQGVTSIMMNGVFRGVYPLLAKAHSHNSTPETKALLETRYNFINGLENAYPRVTGFNRKYILALTCNSDNKEQQIYLDNTQIGRFAVWGANNDITSVSHYTDITSVMNTITTGHKNVYVTNQSWWYIQRADILVYDVPVN